MIKVKKYKKLKKLYATTYIPAFIAPNMKEYGGFEVGSVVRVPSSVMELLLTRGLVSAKKPKKIKKKAVKPVHVSKKELKSIPSNEEMFLRIVRANQAKMDYVPLIEVRQQMGVSEPRFRETQRKLQMKGDIYLPRHGFVRLTSKM